MATRCLKERLRDLHVWPTVGARIAEIGVTLPSACLEIRACVFRTKNATQSGANKPVVPIYKSQRFRAEPSQYIFRKILTNVPAYAD